jgi:hypothetical protein
MLVSTRSWRGVRFEHRECPEVKDGSNRRAVRLGEATQMRGRLTPSIVGNRGILGWIKPVPTIRTEEPEVILAHSAIQIRMSLWSSGVVTHRSRKPNWPLSITSHAASSKPLIAAR